MKPNRERKVLRRTRFSCRAPDAGKVFLAGTFNGWKPDATPLTNHGDGTWSVHVDLPLGRHEFKFVVDSAWCCEPGEDETKDDFTDRVPNCFGTTNRVVEVT